MGSQTSAQLVTELKRRITNLSDAHALAALNRAGRYVTSMGSFQFLLWDSEVLTVNTLTLASTSVSGTLSVVVDNSDATWVSGGTFETDGSWAPLLGPFPPVATGNPSKTIAIGDNDFPIYWVKDSTHLVILGTFPDATGTYPYTVISDTPSESAGPGTFDPGKARVVLNSDGTMVQHVALSDIWESFNYNLPASTSYNVYTVVSDNTTTPPTHRFLFFPALPGVVTLYYHRTMTDLLGGSDKTPFPKDFDDLIVELAEAEERRLYDVGDSWQILMARCQERIKVLSDAYRSMSQQATSLQDAQTKQMEVTQLGRS